MIDRDLLERALGTLDPEWRAIVVLHYFLEMPLPEVARIVGIPLGTAKSRLHRALGILRTSAGLDTRPGRRVSQSGAVRMSAFDRFERELPSALTDVAGGGRSDYLTDILGRTARTRQRPAWASLERWLPMDLVIARTPVARIPWRTVAVVAALLILLVAVVALYAGSQRRVPLPFGPAANGVIPFDSNGDILVADPITGSSRVVLGGPDNDYGPTFST